MWMAQAPTSVPRGLGHALRLTTSSSAPWHSGTSSVPPTFNSSFRFPRFPAKYFKTCKDGMILPALHSLSALFSCLAALTQSQPRAANTTAVDDLQITVRLKHGIHTIFLFAMLDWTFSRLSTELLSILRDRYPDGLRTSRTDTTPVPANDSDVKVV